MKDKFHSKKERCAFEQFVHNHIEHILRCGNLSHYYLRSLDDQEPSELGMSIVNDPKYLDFTLHYNQHYAASEWHRGGHDELIATLCHEVTHIVAGEIDISPKVRKMADIIDPLFERFVEHTSRWLLRCYYIYMLENKIELRTGLKKLK